MREVRGLGADVASDAGQGDGDHRAAERGQRRREQHAGERRQWQADFLVIDATSGALTGCASSPGTAAGTACRRRRPTRCQSRAEEGFALHRQVVQAGQHARRSGRSAVTRSSGDRFFNRAARRRHRAARCLSRRPCVAAHGPARRARSCPGRRGRRRRLRPGPRIASMTRSSAPFSGFFVNITPAQSGSIMRCTTTPTAASRPCRACAGRRGPTRCARIPAP